MNYGIDACFKPTDYRILHMGTMIMLPCHFDTRAEPKRGLTVIWFPMNTKRRITK